MIESLKHLWRLKSYRARLVDGIANDLRTRYVGSVMGVMWVVMFPLMQLTIYGMLYSVIFRIRVPGLTELEYVVLVFSGLVPLMAFSETLNGALNSLSSNKSLLLNTVFPAELIPMRAAIGYHIPSLFGLSATLTMGYLTGLTDYKAIFLVPIFWTFLVMFSLGIGWILSLVSLILKDIQHGISLVIMSLFFLSPFAYTPDMVPQGLKFILYFNPLSYFVMTFQQIICYGAWPDPVNFIPCIVLGTVSFICGFHFFQKSKNVFFDYA
ncbi:MAG: ABC transporter permease [Parvibaculales bacterium]